MNKLKKFSSSISDLFRTTNVKYEDEPEPISIAERYPLHNAAVFGNSVEVEFLLNSNRNCANQEDDKGRIPLHYSVQHYSTYISQLLIKYGANVDSVDYTEATPAHFAAKEGQIENSCLLLTFGADFCVCDKIGKTAFDVAAEEGHIELIKFLIKQNCHQPLLSQIEYSESKPINTPFHLAARNGHVEIVYLLFNAGFPLNYKTSQGTALHEGVKHGRLQVVRLLLYLGIDSSAFDSYNLTAEDYGIQVISRNPVTAPAILELLEEAHNKVYGIALRDFFQQQTYDHHYRGSCPRGSELPLKAGDLIWILENPKATDKLFWRGITFTPTGISKCGYFPRKFIKIQMGYEIHQKMNENSKHHRKIKKVNVPSIPEISKNDIIESAFNLSNTTDYHTDSGSNASDRNSFYTNSSAPLPGMSPTPSRAESCLFDSTATVASFTDDDYSCSETVAVASNPMSRSCSTMMQHANSYGSIAPNYSIASTESYHSSGFNSARGGHSRYPTAGSSNSLSSSTHINNQRSSSSCMIDKNNLHCNGNSRSSSTICPPGSSVPYRLAQPIRNHKNRHKVAEMITKGVSEMEVLADWLNSLGFSNYLQLFVSQGYDLSSIARVTPQDLISLGITQPNHRRQLIQDIHQWNITDGYPSYVPSSNGIRDFLSAIGLSQYIELFESQKYNTIKDLEELSWEDLEDVGVKKLGHMKRLCIALKKLKTNREARQKKNAEAAAAANYHSSEGNYQQANDYLTSTLTSRSSTALGDHGSFESACNTLRKPSRMSMPEQRQRPIAPVLPSHHVSTSSENIKLSSKDKINKSECDSPIPTTTIESQKEHHFSLDTRKPAKLNLITKDQILSKLDDIENDDAISISIADDIPPSPAPISCNSALERIYAIKNHRPNNNFEMYQGNYQLINGSNGLPITSHLRYHHNDEPYINDMDHLNDLGQMLRDLTDELDAKLNPCGSTAV